MLISFFLTLNLLAQSAGCPLPEEIENILSAYEPALSHADSSSLVSDWNIFMDTKCPTLVSGDFNGDGNDDFALIAFSEIPEKTYYLLIIESTPTGFKTAFNRDCCAIYDEGLGTGIALYSPGEINALDTNFVLKNHGILLQKFESSASVFFKDNGEYKQVYIGD